MGAQVALDDARWLTPLPLWAGILAGPVAWAFDLEASYAVVTWVCHTQHHGVLPVITLVSLGIASCGAVLSGNALMRTANATPTDGGQPRQRARFMAVLGVASSALFVLQILAGALPHWMLDACQ